MQYNECEYACIKYILKIIYIYISYILPHLEEVAVHFNCDLFKLTDLACLHMAVLPYCPV